MKDKSNKFAMRSFVYGLILTWIIYTIIAFLAVYMFGTSIQSSVLDNIGEENKQWDSYVLRVAFMIVIGCHVPFIFFSGKESLLVIIDEIDRRSVSESLERILLSL